VSRGASPGSPPASAPAPTEASFVVHDTPIGALLLAVTEVGVVGVEGGDPVRALVRLEEDLGAEPVERPGALDDVRRQLDEYFEGRRRTFDLALDARRSHGFYREVLEEVVHIPWGEVVSYGDLAAMSGRPRAARAAGTAMASNPITVIRPCHRVVHADGRLGGYGGRPEVKRYLLELEGVKLPR
jgi:methylated-DNA-[protein]-cysteine S-methyltransferase